MKRYGLVAALLTLVVMGQDVTSWNTAPSGLTVLEAQDNPVAMSEDSVAAGRVIYVRFCSSCHGTEGEGDGAGAFGDVPPSNLVDDEWDHGGSDGEIFKTIREGVPPDYYMEMWEGRISDEDIWNTVNYIRDLANR